MTGRPYRDGSPLWEKVYAAIHGQIQDGTLRPGARLDPVAEIARTHDVSRATVSRALSVLRRRGFVVSRPGEGYWVTRVQDL